MVNFASVGKTLDLIIEDKEAQVLDSSEKRFSLRQIESGYAPASRAEASEVIVKLQKIISGSRPWGYNPDPQLAVPAIKVVKAIFEKQPDVVPEFFSDVVKLPARNGQDLASSFGPYNSFMSNGLKAEVLHIYESGGFVTQPLTYKKAVAELVETAMKAAPAKVTPELQRSMESDFSAWQPANGLASFVDQAAMRLNNVLAPLDRKTTLEPSRGYWPAHLLKHPVAASTTLWAQSKITDAAAAIIKGKNEASQKTERDRRDAIVSGKRRAFSDATDGLKL